MFKKYDKYKDSGIEGILEIPDNWEVKRLRELGKLQNGISKGAEYFGQGSPFVSYGNIYNNTIRYNQITTYCDSTKDEQKIYSVLENDVFFTRTSETLDEIGISGTCLETINKATFSGFTIRFRPGFNKIYKGFSFYFFNSYFNRCFLSKNSNIVTRVSLGQGLLNKTPVLLPKKEKQIEIASFLDENTENIDKTIVLLTEKKSNYLELKQKVIYDCVTKGLNKNIELKDSGIDWVGGIPTNWTKDRLKNIFKERVGKNKDKKTGEPITTNILSVVKDIGVINHRDKGLVGNKMSEDISGYKLVDINDIVVNKMNVIIGSVGISKEYGALSVIYIILITRLGFSPRYYDYIFRVKAFQKSLRQIATGILEIREAINMKLFMGLEFPIPSENEQIEIANYLDEKTVKIDEIIKTIDENIDRLKEYRKVLINDTVTGKIKVI